jgi:hypothetical protein
VGMAHGAQGQVLYPSPSAIPGPGVGRLMDTVPAVETLSLSASSPEGPVPLHSPILCWV